MVKKKIVTKNKNIHLIHQVVMINIYAPNNRALKQMKQELTELKEEINNSNGSLITLF